MSSNSAHSSTHDASEHEEDDVTESLIHSIPVVLPLVGAALIFLLAFIAIMMA